MTIDMLSLTLQTALENYGKERFIAWLLAGKQFHILMLSPYSTAAKLRSLEEFQNETDLPAKIFKQIETLKSLFSLAEKQLKDKEYAGSFEVRLYNDIPYFSYFHTENTMAVGLYYAHIQGLQSEALLIGQNSTIYQKMAAHFDKLWKHQDKRGNHKTTLCIISKARSHFHIPSSLPDVIPQHQK